jgi:hypothetical protein
MNNLNLLTVSSLKQFESHFGRMHDTSLKSFSYEFNHDGKKRTKSMQLKILGEDYNKQWQDQWSHWVTIYVLIENVIYLNIFKGHNNGLKEKIIKGKLGILENSAFIALDGGYPQTELDDFPLSIKSDFLIIGERCYWNILPYEPRGN